MAVRKPKKLLVTTSSTCKRKYTYTEHKTTMQSHTSKEPLNVSNPTPSQQSSLNYMLWWQRVYQQDIVESKTPSSVANCDRDCVVLLYT